MKTIDTMTLDELAENWLESFKCAQDLYPEVPYDSHDYCRRLAATGIEIRKLARTQGILLMAHYYMRPEIQKVAHFVGDSLGLGLKAKELLDSGNDPTVTTDMPITKVWLSAVRFMGDTMKVVLSDRMRVFMPKFAGCSLVASLRGLPFDYRNDSEPDISKQLMKKMRREHPIDTWRRSNPDGLVLSYMNSDPEAKAKSYAVFTSRNAMRVLEYTMRENAGKRIFMLPDQYLSELVLRMAKLQKNPWIKPELVDVFPGLCHVHKQKISPYALDEAMEAHPNADLLVHPECGCAVECLIRATTGHVGGKKTYISSTQEMIWQAEKPDSKDEFIVATETGHIFTLRDKVPQKKFYPVSAAATCEFMKSTKLEDLLAAMRAPNSRQYEVILPEAIIKDAMTAINRMLEIK